MGFLDILLISITAICGGYKKAACGVGLWSGVSDCTKTPIIVNWRA